LATHLLIVRDYSRSNAWSECSTLMSIWNTVMLECHLVVKTLLWKIRCVWSHLY